MDRLPRRTRHYPTIDIDVARQYDFFADFPRYPLNLLADLNVVVGLFFGSHDYRRVTLDPTDPNYDPHTVVQQVGDTTYYLIPDPHLPLLEPLRVLGVPSWFVDSLEPVLRSIVELGYDRTTPYGQPAPAIVFPTPGRRLQLPGNSIDCQSFGVEAPGARLLCV